MTISTKLNEKLEGADNFRAWKYRVVPVLEENDLEGFIEADIPDREGEALALKEGLWVLQGNAIALQGQTLALLEGELAHQGEEALAQLQEEALVHLQEEALEQQGGQTRRPNPSATRRENSSHLVSIYCQFFRFKHNIFLCM